MYVLGPWYSTFLLDDPNCRLHHFGNRPVVYDVAWARSLQTGCDIF